jgi:carboxymethylenebutenolidase
VGRPRGDEQGGADGQATDSADRGNEDRAPSPEQVNQHEAELKKHGKDCEFHRYDGAGHGFFYYDRPMYRVEQALNGWQKVFAFLYKRLAA